MPRPGLIVAAIAIAVGMSACSPSVTDVEAGPDTPERPDESDPSDEHPADSVPRTPGQLLFTDHRDLYVAPDTGGAVVHLTPDQDDLKISYGEWSRSGTHIAYVGRSWETGKRDLYMMAADGSGRRMVSDVAERVHASFAWSPDGRRIAFSAGTRIYTVDLEGNDQVEITRGALGGVNPDWSPDGAWIVFQGRYDGERVISGIYRVRSDGSEYELLVELPWTYERWPRYSPDGEHVVFEHDEDLHLIDAEGGEARRLTFSPAERDWFARWAPDGETLAFITPDRAGWSIGLLDVETSTFLGRIGDPDSNQLFPAWSPDGALLAFQHELYMIAVAEPAHAAEWEDIGVGSYVSWRPIP